MHTQNILVIGASGVVGSEVVKNLRAQGHKVRTTSSKEGKDAVKVNVSTREGLAEAFTGVDAAFIMSPGGYAGQDQILSPMIQEAKRQGLKKVVLMSALGANANDAAPLRKAELELIASGLNYTIIRPNWFMQNFTTFWVQGIKGEGKIPLPAGSAKTSFLDTRDIGAVAAKVLTDSRYDRQELDLTGAEALSHAEVAQHISLVTGREVAYQDVEPVVLRRTLLSWGVPEDYTDFLLLIFGYLKEGYNAGVNSNVKLILGREPISFAQYARDHKAAWTAEHS